MRVRGGSSGDVGIKYMHPNSRNKKDKNGDWACYFTTVTSDTREAETGGSWSDADCTKLAGDPI
jgi:hypothetical protein